MNRFNTRGRRLLVIAGIALLAICLAVPTAWAFEGRSGDVIVIKADEVIDDDLYVGDTSAGMMLVDAGSAVNSRRSYVGDDAGVIGFVIVDGVGSTWTINSSLYVGNAGVGNLGITRGGQVSSRGGYLGYYWDDSSGTVTVDGAGSTWTNSGKCL